MKQTGGGRFKKSTTKRHSITPESIEKDITSIFEPMYEIKDKPSDRVSETVAQYDSLEDLDDIIKNLKKEMKRRQKNLNLKGLRS